MPASNWTDLYRIEERAEAAILAVLSAAMPAVQVLTARDSDIQNTPCIGVVVQSTGNDGHVIHHEGEPFLAGWNVQIDVAIMTSRPVPRGSLSHADITAKVREVFTKDISVFNTMSYHAFASIVENSASLSQDDDNLHDVTTFTFGGVVHILPDAYPTT